MEDESCGKQFEIDSVDLVAFGQEEPIRTYEGTTLICSLPWGHTPANRHSDGVNDWMDDSE